MAAASVHFAELQMPDAIAMFNLGGMYYRGEGLTKDYVKANELLLRAGENGHATACTNLGNSYLSGRGVERDTNKAIYYYELAAMRGDAEARYNLGAMEGNVGNMSRAVKHWMISAGAGCDKSLKQIREGFLYGHATKGDFEKALRPQRSCR